MASVALSFCLLAVLMALYRALFLARPPHPARRFVWLCTTKSRFCPVEKVLWIEAANKYVVIHSNDRTYVARQTIQSLEDELDPKMVVRIHRSTLVHKEAVRGLHPLFHGD